jgi:hypothetical protein
MLALPRRGLIREPLGGRRLVLQQRPEISGPAGVVGFAGGGLVAASPA